VNPAAAKARVHARPMNPAAPTTTILSRDPLSDSSTQLKTNPFTK
jgi:hypothetical protein